MNKGNFTLIACMAAAVLITSGLPLQGRDLVGSPADPETDDHSVGQEGDWPGTEGESGLESSIFMERTVFLLGEPIQVRCAITNVTTEDITIVKPMLTGPGPGLYVIVENAEGEMLPQPRGVRAPPLWLPETDPSCWITSLSPGEALPYNVDLREQYEKAVDPDYMDPVHTVEEPGTYSVRCAYGNTMESPRVRLWSGLAISPAIRFQVVER